MSQKVRPPPPCIYTEQTIDGTFYCLFSMIWADLNPHQKKDYNAPFVLGNIPSALGSCSTAIFNARAVALNTLSIIW